MTLFKPIPLPDESLYSYLYRLAVGAHIGIEALIGFYSTVSINYMRDTKIFENARELVGNNKVFESLLLNKFDSSYFKSKKKENSKITHHYLSNWTRFCPHCLKAKKYHRISWDIRAVTVCQFHKTFLINECQRCHERIKIKDLFLERCRCGYIYSLSKSNIVTNENILRSQELLYEALNFNNPIMNSTNREIQPAEFFNAFHSVLKILEGSSSNNELYSEFKIKDKIMSFMHSRKINDDIFLISMMVAVSCNTIIDLSKRKLKFLYELVDANKRNTREHIKSILNYEESCKDTYLDYIFNIKKELYSPWSKIFSSIDLESSENKYLTIAEAATYLRSSVNHINKLAEAGEIPYQLKVFNSQQIKVFKESALIKWKENFESFLTSRDVGALLDVGRRHVLQLVEYELLNPIISKEHLPIKYLFKKEDVVNFIQKLQVKVETEKIYNQNDDYFSIVNIAKETNAKISNIILLIQQNEISTICFQKNTVSLKNIFVSKYDLKYSPPLL
ncbi:MULTISPECIES: TniQ family protein [Paenibacillus]|uniref:TniQ family protein n=1 Tax=Paenibacillus TaxID=44249 RepID=UPI00096EDD0F|nr:TniQ family protein [Paenibacillus odorifer]OME13954.1 hypothetical protein BSK60_13955 [Paenibacillus odorifer]